MRLGKLPNERSRQVPKEWIISQGLHPHPGPSIYDCGFDDPDCDSWLEEGNEPACWPDTDSEAGYDGEHTDVANPREVQHAMPPAGPASPVDVWDEMRAEWIADKQDKLRRTLEDIGCPYLGPAMELNEPLPTLAGDMSDDDAEEVEGFHPGAGLQL